MISITTSDDDKVIWFYKCYLSDGNVIYLTDKDVNITLTNTYDGNSVEQSSNTLDESFDFTNGGAIGSVANINLAITRDSANTLLNGFHNEFYPNTTTYLIGSLWEIGIGWDGITDESDIVWLYEFYTQDISFSYDRMDISLYSFDFYKTELPKHIIQKENQYANYYLPFANKEDIGTTLPILYGDFTFTNFATNQVRLAYTICINITNAQYVWATHKCKETIYSDYSGTLTEYEDMGGYNKKYVIFRYLENGKNYLELFNTYNSDTLYTDYVVNSNSISYINIMAYRTGYTISGNFTINQFVTHKESDFILPYTFGKDTDDNVEIGISEALVIKPNVELSESDLGLLNITNTDIKLRVQYQSKTGSNVNLFLGYYNDLKSMYSTQSNFSTSVTGANYAIEYFSFATNTSAKNTTDLPFTIEELISYGYVINNKNTSSDIINLGSPYWASLILLNIVVSHVTLNNRNTRNNDGSRATPKIKPR